MSPRLKQLPEGQDPGPIESVSIAPDTMTRADDTAPRPSRIAGIVADEGAPTNPPIGRRTGEVNSAAAVAKYAKAELEAITGLDADHVSSVMNKPDGWHVTVDLVELRRIPAATDVLAAYEAVLGPTGVLLSYRRARRYFRDQMIEES